MWKKNLPFVQIQCNPAVNEQDVLHVISSWYLRGALRDDTKNGCVANHSACRNKWGRKAWRTPKNVRGGGLACVTTGALWAKLGERILAHKAPVMQAREASREVDFSRLQSFHFRFARKMGREVAWLVTGVSHYFGGYLRRILSNDKKGRFPRLWLEQTQSAKKSAISYFDNVELQKMYGKVKVF